MSGERRYVVLGEEWGRHPSSAQHLFASVARRRRVLWVEDAGHRRAPVGPPSGVQVMRAFAPPFRGAGWSERMRAGWLARAVGRELGSGGGEIILVTTGLRGAGVVGRLKEAVSVYFCDREPIPGSGGARARSTAQEAELVKHVDLVVATAASLFEKKSGQHARVRFLPPGVDWDAFRTGRGRVPAEISAMSRPRIGFVGNLDARVSAALLDPVAAAMADATFVLVGRRARSAGPLEARANVRFVPEVAAEDVPAVVSSFDVGMLPLLSSSVAHPLQLREMLAAGIPVVSTPMAEAQRYAGLVHIARDTDEWVAALRSALREGRTRADERSRAVREETWERRAEELERFVGETWTALRGGS